MRARKEASARWREADSRACFCWQFSEEGTEWRWPTFEQPSSTKATCGSSGARASSKRKSKAYELKEDSEDEETRQLVLGLVGDIDGDNPQHPLKQNSSASVGAQMKKDTAKAETDLLFGQIEEAKTVEIKNPESQDNELRAYLIKDLKKMCRYDRNLLQILTKAQHGHYGQNIQDQSPTSSATAEEDLQAFKELDLTEDELNQVRMILDSYTKSHFTTSKDQANLSGFSAVLQSADDNMVSIDQLIIQLNDFSPDFKLLDSNQEFRNDP